MIRINTFLIMFVIPIVVLAEPVNDGDQTSAANDDIFSDVETVKNILMVYQALKYADAGKDTYKEIKDVIDKDWDKFKDWAQGASLGGLKNKTWSKIFQYKHTKAGFFKMLFNYANSLDGVLAKAQNKINEWNTTLPALKSMKDGMIKMVNNTVEVMQEFKWSDLYDIDRKFDKKMNRQVRHSMRTLGYYSGYLRERWNRVNDVELPPDSIYAYYYGLFVPKKDVTDSMYNMVLMEADAFTFLPEDILINCIEAITFNYEIMMNSQAQDDKIYAAIDSSLANTRRTMEDEHQIQAAIERYKYSLGVTTAELEQILLALEQRYARLLLRKKERQAMENEKYYEVVEKFLQVGI